MGLASKVTLRSFLVPALIVRSARSRSAEVVDASSRPILQGSPKGLWVCSGTCFQCNAPRGTGDFIFARNAREQTRVPAKRSAYHFVITFSITRHDDSLVVSSWRWRGALVLGAAPSSWRPPGAGVETAVARFSLFSFFRLLQPFCPSRPRRRPSACAAPKSETGVAGARLSGLCRRARRSGALDHPGVSGLLRRMPARPRAACLCVASLESIAAPMPRCADEHLARYNLRLRVS
jgi:hypothetical protein